MLEEKIKSFLFYLTPKEERRHDLHVLINNAKQFVGIDPGRVYHLRVFKVAQSVNEEKLNVFASTILTDPVQFEVNTTLPQEVKDYQSFLVVSKHPGVTDDEGAAAQRALEDYLGKSSLHQRQFIFTQDLYCFEQAIDAEMLGLFGEKFLGNPLINNFKAYSYYLDLDLDATYKTLDIKPGVETFNLNQSDNDLLTLSKERYLCLDLAEMRAIKDYFDNDTIIRDRMKKGLSADLTDCELEIFAQTWSEHCKHKEFNAIINYYDEDTGEQRIIDSLFKSKIKKSTSVIQERLREHGHDWLVKVFSDNAGLVKVDDDTLLAWKVETHNTPSALDPYGGAITGILGCNRDAVGTGTGGAKPLFNTNVLCFASPDYNKPLLAGQLHPKRIMKGVVEGIMDGGNKMGIPTVNGSIVFDDRYSGKPLVFCGTGSLMPAVIAGESADKKPIAVGDLIVMAGGRVGKDGIHGATLSSVQTDETTPQTIVQIGSPVTQKLLFDFLEQACLQGLVKTCTDNGAGGLSSSIGEMAELAGGACVQLDKVPLKYPGLQPWEIFLSESQERMTLVVDPSRYEALEAMAESYEVEVSAIGSFNRSRKLDVRYGDQQVAFIDLEFLHEGVPQKKLEAVWKRPEGIEPGTITVADYNKILLKLLSANNVCSREPVIRRYDHEVKGKTIVKPLMEKAPQDAGVMRLGFNGYRGVAISNGIIPRYGDIDAYHMSAGAFDEAVRQIISVGGRLPKLEEGHCSVWSVNDNFCVPDSVFDPKSNPDGKYKLAQLVRMCDALYDMSTAYNIPLTSGKDSMKNDFKGEAVKISVPPTVLYSMVATIDDVRKVTTTEFKAPGDKIYLVGQTKDELGGSEFYKLYNEMGVHVPRVDPGYAKKLYEKVYLAQAAEWVASCHDLSDGGLAVALAESCFGGEWGAQLSFADSELTLNAFLFSESHSRFLMSVRPGYAASFETLMGGDALLLGEVSAQPTLTMNWYGQKVLNVEVADLLKAWEGGLSL